ncbi:mersacidin/lichenicidin family type 2 lantibiotic [Micromonospora sp. AP08]|nr:mersacidin/lichenicidin family type 2 lantibiotic [Micromonospora sp. AP08]
MSCLALPAGTVSGLERIFLRGGVFRDPPIGGRHRPPPPEAVVARDGLRTMCRCRGPPILVGGPTGRRPTDHFRSPRRRTEMNTPDVIRAWTDPAYRATLSAAELAEVPDHPSGVIELSDADLASVAGGAMCSKTTYSTNNTLGWRCL